MRHELRTPVVVVAALVLSALTVSGVARTTADAGVKPRPTPSPTTSPMWDLEAYPPNPATDNVVLIWNEHLLETIRKNPAGTGPTVTARALGVVHTSMYDAWAAYDPVAKRTQSSGVDRRPSQERTPANKSKAISYAAYETLVDLFPYRTSVYSNQMAALYGSGFESDTSMAATVGRKAAEANIAFRHADGANQTLNANNTVSYPYDCAKLPGTAECYSPINQWNNVVDRFAWQPLCVLTGAGVAAKMPPKPADGNCVGPNYSVQQPATPQWRYMKPFALQDALQYKVPGPPKNADGTYSTVEIEQEYTDATGVEPTTGKNYLGDVEKTKAEYWADGPASVFPPGHDMIFAQALSRRQGHSLDTDVKMFFALGNAMLDSSVAAWAQKYIYDYVRPLTAIREYYKGQQIRSWWAASQGPCPDGSSPVKGFCTVPAEQWMPYQALNVVTPPFPEYVSGHSTFSGAGAQVLMAFTGSDGFNAKVTIKAGSSAIEAGTPATDVTLYWPTFSAAADEAGMSRRYGGIHFYSGDLHGRMIGKMVGSNAFSKAQAYSQGYSGYAS